MRHQVLVVSVLALVGLSACGDSDKVREQAASGPTCEDWLQRSEAERETLAKEVVGSTNLQLRVEAVTGTCTLYVDQNGMSGVPVGEELTNLAEAAPEPVKVDIDGLPPTIDPSDPHQCLKRMSSAVDRVTGSSKEPVYPEDCLAMGF